MNYPDSISNTLKFQIIFTHPHKDPERKDSKLLNIWVMEQMKIQAIVLPLLAALAQMAQHQRITWSPRKKLVMLSILFH